MNLTLGTYILQPYARSEEHIKALADCKISIVFCIDKPDRETLDLLEKYNIRAVVSGIVPNWWGGDGSKGRLCEHISLDMYDKAAEGFEMHPAIVGIDIGDEPSALDFPYYGKILEKMRSLFPDVFPYLNLYPNYASVSENSDSQTLSQLGTRDYSEYIERYINEIELNYISYDFYVYSCRDLGKMFENYRIVTDACKKTGKAFLYIPQVNSEFPEIFTSENMLRFQAYTALAYGAEYISWACWTRGWWTNNVLDLQGNKTEQFEKLKRINTELLAFGEIYNKYRWKETHLIGFENEPSFAPFDGLKTETEVSIGVFENIRAEGTKGLSVGYMTGTDGDALCFCNADDYMDSAKSCAEISFYVEGENVSLHSCESSCVLTRGKDGRYSFRLENCHGAIITVNLK